MRVFVFIDSFLGFLIDVRLKTNLEAGKKMHDPFWSMKKVSSNLPIPKRGHISTSAYFHTQVL